MTDTHDHSDAPQPAESPVMDDGSGDATAIPAAAGRDPLDLWLPLGGILLCVLVFLTYLGTMGTTVPFWDAGEFIATSKILGIPHPPGTPLYILLGRIACLVPFGPIAARVNALSAVSATIAVLFTYLATIKMVRGMWSEEKETPWWLALISGLVAGFALAFSETFWINAIEAEVYGISSMVMAISIWAVLQWREHPRREQQVGWLLVIFYMLSLSIGVHLGTYLVLPGLFVLVGLEWIHAPERRRAFAWVLIAAVVVLPALAMLVAVGGIQSAGFEALMRYLVKWVPIVGTLLVAGLILLKRPRFGLAILGLLLLGVSVHFYLIIRAGVDPPPAINEANPSNWRALWSVLMREQYPPSDIFIRSGSPEGVPKLEILQAQFGRMYLYYLKRQFSLAPGILGMAVPLALGFLGSIAQLVWRRRDAAMMLTHFWVMCFLLVIFLNLSVEFNAETGIWERGEVRERDYFFVPSFQIFAIWIGMGVATIGLEVWRLANTRSARRMLAAATAVIVIVAGIPVARGFADRYAANDRTDNYIARDYGYNILAFLEPDAILFTNGDNDTFPLWYLQEVEGVRKDVRVVCLSLLNTDWYIKQCRDLEPQVPMTFADDLIDNMQVAFDPRSQGIFVVDARVPGPAGIIGAGTVKDVAVRDIVATNAFERPIYFAVTVPDRVGFDRQLSFEGMVFRVLPDSPGRGIDFDQAYENAFENYSYRGLLVREAGFARDPAVIVDETGEYLVQNYVNMFTQLAYELQYRGRSEEAYQMLTAARSINPEFIQLDLLEGMLLDDMGRYDEAVAAFEAIIANGRAVLDAHYRLAFVHYNAGRTDLAVASMQEAARLAGGGFIEPTLWLARFFWDAGRVADARLTLSSWMAAHPDDDKARRVLEHLSQNDDSLLPRPSSALRRPGSPQPDPPAERREP